MNCFERSEDNYLDKSRRKKSAPDIEHEDENGKEEVRPKKVPIKFQNMFFALLK